MIKSPLALLVNRLAIAFLPRRDNPQGIVRQWLLAENDLCPRLRVKKFTEKKPEPRSMRKEDAAKLIASAEGKMKFLLVFLFTQGWRVSDTLRLQYQDIDLNKGTVRYHITKTDEWFEMPLHADVIAYLREEQSPAQIGRVFPWRGREKLYRQLRPLCRRVGVFFTPHMARHSFATWLSDEGASVFEIMKAGAWKDYRSVHRYTNVDVQRVRATLNRIRFK